MGDSWYGFWWGICTCINFNGLMFALLGDFKYERITGAEWVLSEHPAWRIIFVGLCVIGLVCSVVNVAERG
ncbi:hypothetical protein B5D07_10215 [Limosilactobacillus reuteri]|uniref:Uncharacterized protein n=1 Tax=Limosilactobacillus reuteri TaxID=1598 RepID=A0A1V4FIY8_LIMRT|nr:hypothetical protein B5D07_10215 [Limosilactobacillus reuteri]